MASTMVLEQILEEEAALRTLVKSDPEKAVTWARDLAQRCHDALQDAPDDDRVAAAWLRTLRRAELPRDEVAPVLESMEARFPGSREVQAALTWLWSDAARDRLATGDVDPAADLLGRCLAALNAQRDPAYLALSLLGGMRVLAECLQDDRAEAFEDRVVALDRLLDAVEVHAAAWLAALPEVSPEDATSGRADLERGGARGLPGPRLRGCLLLRRLCRQAERWTLLASVGALARELGVESEWLADAEVEASARAGDPARALAVVREARRRFPRSEQLARREARLLAECGRDADAIDLLLQAAAASRTPWPWRDLAERILATGRVPTEVGGASGSPPSALEWAVAAFEAGLSFHDPREAGMVWRLHLELARSHLELGDETRAGEEAWLAREARVLAGWGVGRDLQEFLDAHAPHLLPHLERLDRAPAGQSRATARQRYHRSHAKTLRSIARPGEVLSVRAAFGFLRVDGIPGNVFFSRTLLGSRSPATGDRVLAVVVRSFDTKKNRDSHRAVWLGPRAETP